MSIVVLALCMGLGLASGPEARLELPLQTLLDQVVSEKAQKYHCGVSVTVLLGNGTKISATSGQRSFGTTSQPVSNHGTLPIALSFKDDSLITFHFQVSPSDKFIWGSVTKLITGTNILQLVGEGKLSLSDKVVKCECARARRQKYCNAARCQNNLILKLYVH